MKDLTDAQLGKLLNNLSSETLPENFAQNVMRQIYWQEQKEFGLLRKLIYSAWGILGILIGVLASWSYLDLAKAGFFEFVQVFWQNLSTEYAGDILRTTLNTLPWFPISLVLVFVGFLFFSIYIHKKLPKIAQGVMKYA